MTQFKTRVSARAVSAVTAGLLILSGVATAFAPAASATASVTTSRLSGQNRYSTAVAIANKFGAAPTDVIIASGENFPDAMSAAGYAGSVGAPIVLAQKDALPSETDAYLKALTSNPKVHVMGGLAAIGAATFSAIDADTTGAVDRISGLNRAETACAAAVAIGSANIGTFGTPPLKAAWFATQANFPDALTLGPMAWARKLPVFLVGPTLAQCVKDQIAALGIKKALIAGGTAAVTAANETELVALTGNPAKRYGGATRNSTATLLADGALADFGFDGVDVLLATNSNFPDALAGGPWGGKTQAPILLVPSTDTSNWLKAHAATVNTITALGGTSVITDAQLAAAKADATPGAPTSNQTYTTSPSTKQTVTSSSTATYTDSASLLTYTISGLGTNVVDIALFPCTGANAPVTTGNVTTFTPPGGATPVAGPAVGEGTTDRGAANGILITSVNGAPITPAKRFNSVTPNGGSITFTLNNSNANPADCATPVAYHDTETTPNHTLEVDATGKPTEPFTMGGQANYIPAEPATGVISNNTGTTCTIGGGTPCVVTQVDKPNQQFVTDNGKTYKYKSTDTFQRVIGGVCTSTTFTDFVNRLSTGDQVSGSYAPAATSTFCLEDLSPAPPASLTATPSINSNNVVLAFPDSVTPSAASYNLYRANATPFTGGGSTCSAFTTTGANAYTPIKNVVDTSPGVGSSGTYTYTDTTPANASNYCYAVTTVDSGGQESATARTNSGTQTPNSTTTGTPAPGAVAGAPKVNDIRATDNGAPTIIDTGDVIQVIANEPMAASTLTAGAFTVTGANTRVVTITCGGNASCVFLPAGTYNGFTVVANQAIRETLTATPVDGGGFSATYPAAVNGYNASYKDADENLSVDNAGSPDKTLDVAAFAATTGPKIATVAAVGGSTTVTVTYDRALDCTTVDSNGSDYSVKSDAANPPTTVKAVSAAACSNGSGVGVVTLTTAAVGATGQNVLVTAQNGADGDTVGGAIDGAKEPVGDSKQGVTS